MGLRLNNLYILKFVVIFGHNIFCYYNQIKIYSIVYYLYYTSYIGYLMLIDFFYIILFTLSFVLIILAIIYFCIRMFFFTRFIDMAK